MTLAEIINQVSKRLDVDKKLTSGFVHETLDQICAVLDSGGEVKLRGLGTLCWQKVVECPCSGATTGVAPPGKKLRFIPAKHFRGRRPT